MASMDEDTRDFISSMEHKAKKILEKSNQRRVADSQRQLQDAVQETRRQRKARKNGGKGSPPPEKTWDWMGQDGGGTATLADDGGGGGGGGPSVEMYLFIFLKFVSSMIPTISYDFTMDVRASTRK